VLFRWFSAFTLWCSRHRRGLSGNTSARRRLRVIGSVLLLVLGALTCLRVARVDQWRSAWATAARHGAPLSVLLLLPAVSLFIKSLGWRAQLPALFRPSIPRSFVTFVAAQGVNELGFSVLGEPLKVLVLPREARAAGMTAVAADNALAFAALLCVSAVFALCRPPQLLLALGLTGFALFVIGQTTPRCPRSVAGFSAHFVGKLWLSVELGLGLHLLGEPTLVNLAELSLAWSSAAALGAPIPGQLGVVEAALVHGGASLGISASTLLALALVRRVRTLLWTMLGLLLAARLLSRNTEEVEHASSSIAGNSPSSTRRERASQPLPQA